MPTQVPIEVFRIGHTVVDKDEVQRWMDHIGASEFEIPDDEEITNPALLIALAGKRCYMSFQAGLNKNVTRIRKDFVDYFDNILASGHGSVLEHSVYNFAIEGVSRIFTAEMNRHRAGWAISEGSLRFIRFNENIPYWEPDSIRGADALMGGHAELIQTADPDELLDWLQHAGPRQLQTLEHKQHASRLLFVRAFAGQEQMYACLEAIWAAELAPESKFANKKQITSMMRRIVGLGVATGGVWSGNIRALRHVFAMRASAAAEEEMLHVFSRVIKVMAEKEPLLFGDFYVDDTGYWRPKYVKV
jgi:thymidylate synthase (FAD)